MSGGQSQILSDTHYGLHPWTHGSRGLPTTGPEFPDAFARGEPRQCLDTALPVEGGIRTIQTTIDKVAPYQNENRSAICSCREKFACDVMVPNELLPKVTFGP